MRSRRKIARIGQIIGFYCFIFLIIHFIHCRFFTVRVVLYDALVDVVLGGLTTLMLCVLWLRKGCTLSREEIGLSLVVGLLLTSLYSLIVPTIIDRSLSIYIIEKLSQRGGSIRHSALDEILKKEFFPEHQLIDIRLTEQVNSGTISVSDGCVRLLPRGAGIAAFTRFYRTQLLPRHREINGRLSDDLTDPFRNSKVAVDYACDQSK